jgi:hypothetical protein
VRFRERGIRSNGARASFLAFGEHLEQQLRPGLVQVGVAELVQTAQVNASVAGEGAAELLLVRRLGKLVDQEGGMQLYRSRLPR